jgi:hypothetical protein
MTRTNLALAFIVSIHPCLAISAVAAPPENMANRMSMKSSAERSVGEAWRFKFYKGHWWYWLPSNRWAVYNSQHWLSAPEEIPALVGAGPAPETEKNAPRRLWKTILLPRKHLTH